MGILGTDGVLSDGISFVVSVILGAPTYFVMTWSHGVAFHPLGWGSPYAQVPYVPVGTVATPIIVEVQFPAGGHLASYIFGLGTCEMSDLAFAHSISTV